jgi:Telomeric repeat-binding factor 2.
MAVVWVLVILAAIGAIVGGDGGTTAGSTPQVASQSAQPGATSQSASAQTQIGNLLFTVNGVSPYSDPRIPAEAGTHYVAVDLGIKNAGDQTGLNSSDFTVKDSAGHIDLSATTFGPEPLLGLVSIIAGQEVRGFVVFKIADGRDPVELRYRLDLFTNGGTIPLPTPIP